jgi:hypothetical protein
MNELAPTRRPGSDESTAYPRNDDDERTDAMRHRIATRPSRTSGLYLAGEAMPRGFVFPILVLLLAGASVLTLVGVLPLADRLTGGGVAALAPALPYVLVSGCATRCCRTATTAASGYRSCRPRGKRSGCAR